MLHQDVNHISLTSLHAAAADRPLVLLQPWARHHQFLRGCFTDERTDGLLYYRVMGHQQPLRAWLGDMRQELAQVIDGFGGNLAQALPDASPETLGLALAADLEALAIRPAVLYLDDFGGAVHDDDLQVFVAALVTALPSGVRLALNARLMFTEPWRGLIVQGQARVLGHVQLRDHLSFVAEPEPRPQLEVMALGEGQVRVNGQLVESWDGVLPRNLFFFLIDQPLVTRDQILQIFWASMSVKEATNSFHTTKRKITERLSSMLDKADNYELTQYSAGFYMPSGKMVRHYDVVDFEEAVDQALGTDDPALRMELFRHALDLYAGPFLQSVDIPWAQARRATLQRRYLEALIGLGRGHQARMEHEAALPYFLRAIESAPEREDIRREVMTLYQRLGQPEKAIEQYHALRQHLQDTLAISPSPQTEAAYQQLTSV